MGVMEGGRDVRKERMIGEGSKESLDNDFMLQLAFTYFVCIPLLIKPTMKRQLILKS